jgi:PadR family transcriptional regulator, regulatory protein PadR
LKAATGDKILRDVFLGFIRIHVLHHAAEEPIFGQEMMEELERHGYEVSPGTIYPVLHSLEAAGLLRSRQELVDGRNRKYYRTTAAGNVLLGKLRRQVVELVHEVVHEHVSAERKGARRHPTA